VRYQFVDCRWSLDDPGLGRRLYLEGHIPGASFLDVERDLSSPPGRAGRHPLPSAGQFASAAARAGIGAGVQVVAYGSLGGAERLWWLLRHFGHDACAVLDLDGWRGSLSEGEERIEQQQFTPRARSGDTIDLAELEARREDLVVVDARQPPRWRGEPNPVDRVPGRVPGSQRDVSRTTANPQGVGVALAGPAAIMIPWPHLRLRFPPPACTGTTTGRAWSASGRSCGCRPS